ncbi:hypothetical protein RPW65_07930 [Pseudomonas sp. NyZ704]|nr:hypothetical protein RPW65_07930 [Pseudomonas sp. NyZ704]
MPKLDLNEFSAGELRLMYANALDKLEALQHQFANEAQPVVKPVILPDRAKPGPGVHQFCSGWNNCLVEVERLNAVQQPLPPKLGEK